jgi:integrase
LQSVGRSAHIERRQHHVGLGGFAYQLRERWRDGLDGGFQLRGQLIVLREALDQFNPMPRLDTPLLFPLVRGGVLNLDNWRRREWAPAIEASGTRTPARIYDLRSTFASNALAAGVSVFELARIMGTSTHVIERSYGVLIEGAGAGIACRLDAFDTAQAEASEPKSGV